MVAAIGIIMTCVALPIVDSTLASSKVRSAASSLTGAIQSARYKSIAVGCPYELIITKATSTYQLMYEPVDTTTNLCKTSYSNDPDLPAAVPFATAPVTLGADVTFVFHPSGAVQVFSGTTPLVLTGRYGKTGTLTVSTYGNVTVTYN